jgi:hypothetical protein
MHDAPGAGANSRRRTYLLLTRLWRKLPSAKHCRHCVRHDAVAALFVGPSVRGATASVPSAAIKTMRPLNPGVGVTSAMLLKQPSIHDLCTRDSATTCVARHHSSRADSVGACTSLSLSLIEANIPLFIAQTAAWVRLLTRILRRIALT